MNKLHLLFGLVILVPAIAVTQPIPRKQQPKSAQTEKTIPLECDSTEKIMTALRDQFKEIPLMVGKSLTKQSYTSIWGNPQTKSYTVITTKGDVTCVLDVGDNLEVVINPDKSV